MRLNSDFERYISESLPELEQLIRVLCAIPAPSHHEQARAVFCREWLEKNGGEGVYIDETENVVCPCGVTQDNALAVFMAHTDTVFPDLEPLPFSEDAERMYCPGVTDDSANLAVLLICARYFLQRRVPPRMGLLFVANSCEEGLGNLKGSRCIVERYGSRIRELITMDGTSLKSIVTEAVGSHRYRMRVRTEGGHSFADFGKSNAIHQLAGVVQALYAQRVPEAGKSKTTYNVGLISGGTSVNTIAQEAELLYEYRSDSIACLRTMEESFARIISDFRSAGMEIDVEKIGDRPCAANVPIEAQRALIERVSASIRSVLGEEPICRSGSTDANSALGAGIPALCIGVCRGAKCHTRKEWLDKRSLADGCRLCLDVLAGYFQ